jgi:hypothetical protein
MPYAQNEGSNLYFQSASTSLHSGPAEAMVRVVFTIVLL